MLDTSKFNRSIKDALGMIKKFSQSGSDGSEALKTMSSVIGVTAGAMSGKLMGSFRECTSGLRTVVQNIALSMNDASVKVNEKVTAVKGSLLSIDTCAGAVSEKSRSVANAIKAPFAGLDSTAYGIMSNVGDSLSKGLEAKRGIIISTAKSIADAVTGTLKKALKIASPSKVMKQIGEQTVQGLNIGLVSGRKEIARSAEAMAGAVTGAAYTKSAAAGNDISALAGKLDRLIAIAAGGEQVMQVDGRAFARLIREYS